MKLEHKCTECNKINKVNVTPNAEVKELGFKCPSCNTVNRFLNPYFENTQDTEHTFITGIELAKVLSLKFEVYDYRGTFIEEKHIRKGLNVIGRQPLNLEADNHIQINDETISKVHCTILFEEHIGKIRSIFQDQNSKNSSFINGIKLKSGSQIILQANDIISIGSTHLKSIFSFNNK